jgi:ADP-ribose pyrophosphatase YjhB (NUDIX family)
MNLDRYCNNCKKKGHILKNCNLPIASYGIVSFTNTTLPLKYLLICRKDSLGFVEFVRGKYPIHNKQYIQTLIDEMTINEKNILVTHTFTYIWEYLWGEYIYSRSSLEFLSAKKRFVKICNGVCFKTQSHDLKSLINDSTTSWDTPEWGFPKGRRDAHETNKMCAIREFGEETGYNIHQLHVLPNIPPCEECFIGSNNQTYTHTYYVANFTGNVRFHNIQLSEISDIKWVTYEEAIQLIRPYNTERIATLININNILLHIK